MYYLINKKNFVELNIFNTTSALKPNVNNNNISTSHDRHILTNV